MHKQWIILVVAAALSLASCDQPGCPETQANPILSKSPVDAKEYQQELQRLVAINPVAVDFYFEKRMEINSSNYLAVNCYGEGFCGELWVLLEKEDDMTARLQNNNGYRGARLKGLVLSESTMNGQPELICMGIGAIID